VTTNPKRDEQHALTTYEVETTNEAGHAALWTMMRQTVPQSDLAQHDYIAPEKGTPAAKRSAPTGLAGPERDRLLIEHLSTVRYLARRIHERLPQHVELDDLISAGVVGLIDAFNSSTTTRRSSSRAMRSSAFAGRSSTRCVFSTGARANFAARAAPCRTQFRH
jgi:hypothetical protein